MTEYQDEQVCTKRCYKKKECETMRNLRMSGHRKADRLRMYYCPTCNGYHLTKLVWGYGKLQTKVKFKKRKWPK